MESSLVDPATGFEYKRVDGGVEIVGTTRRDAETLSIPAEIDGEPVVSIGERAFADCPSLERIEVAETIRNTGASTARRRRKTARR